MYLANEDVNKTSTQRRGTHYRTFKTTLSIGLLLILLHGIIPRIFQDIEYLSWIVY